MTQIPKPKTVIVTLATLLNQIANLKAVIDPAQRTLNILDEAKEKLNMLIQDHLPHGSGIDSGTTLCDSSREDKIIFYAPYHHMNENGYYDGWTEYRIRVTPSFIHDIEMKINGRDRNQIKDYLYEVFYNALTDKVVWDNDKGRYVCPCPR